MDSLEKKVGVEPVPTGRSKDDKVPGRLEPALRMMSDCDKVLSFETIEFSANWKQLEKVPQQ